MKILLLTQYFPPEPGAPQARCSEHAAFWAEAGHDVEVCTAFPNYPTGVVPEEYRGSFYRCEKTDGYRIHRSWIRAVPTRGLFNRVAASLSFMFSALVVGILKCQRPDVIVASSGPFFVGPLGWLLSVFKRAPYVIEVRDILPQQAVDLGMIRSKALIAALTAIERFLYWRAKKVITVAKASEHSLVERGIPQPKCLTIENAIRDDFFFPRDKDGPIRDEYEWTGRFIAMYVGTHGVSQGLHTVLDAAALLAKTPDVHFVFVGEGADKPKLIEYADQLGLDNVTFLPAQPKERMPLIYAAADVCLVPLRRGDYFKLNIPSKMFEIMACARPIILGAEGQALSLVQDAASGLAATPEDPQSYADAILRLRDQPDEARAFGESGRSYVVENFTRRKKAHTYLAILEEVVRGN